MKIQKKILHWLFGILLFASSAHSHEFNDLEIHGFASTGYMQSDQYDYLTPAKGGSFEFNEFGINFQTSMSNTIRIGAQLYSYDLGDIGDHDVKLDWAFLDYSWKEYLGVKLGKVKMPFGLYNEVQDYDMLRTPIILPQSVYRRYFRETIISIQGFDIYGNINLNGMGMLIYDAYMGTNELEDDGGIAKFAGNTLGVEYVSGTMNKSMGARLKWKTPINGLLLAGTIYNVDSQLKIKYPISSEKTIEGDYLSPNLTTQIYSAEYSRDNLTLASEYYLYKSNDIMKFGENEFKLPIYYEGYYGQISYRFFDWFELASYYSVFFFDKNNKRGNYPSPYDKYDYYAWQKDLAVCLRFDITDFWLVKFEWHYIDGVALAQVDNPPSIGAAVYSLSSQDRLLPVCDDRYWNLIAIKTTFNF